jgi:hypothetical protein
VPILFVIESKTPVCSKFDAGLIFGEYDEACSMTMVRLIQGTGITFGCARFLNHDKLIGFNLGMNGM